VNRDEIEMGAREMGLELAEHITNTIEAMRPIAPRLGLDGSAVITANSPTPAQS
jgi:hypothetical protein